MTELELATAAARLAEAAGAAALFGAPALLRLAGSPPAATPWARGLMGSAAGLLAVGSLAALLVQTAGMAGSWREALTLDALRGVVGETVFGRSVAVRVAVALAAAALALRADRPAGRAALAALGAVALASLAWSGHGAADGGVLGGVHLAGDLLHLLAAGGWLGALAALVLLAGAARRGPEGLDAARRGLEAFSGVGVAAVATLAASGLVNAWALAGPPQRWLALGDDAWGRLLLAKLALFAAMLALAALNRWRWTPALAGGGGPDRATARALAWTVAAEAGFGVLALTAAAVMGGLAPPAARA